MFNPICFHVFFFQIKAFVKNCRSTEFSRLFKSLETKLQEQAIYAREILNSTDVDLTNEALMVYMFTYKHSIIRSYSSQEQKETIDMVGKGEDYVLSLISDYRCIFFVLFVENLLQKHLERRFQGLDAPLTKFYDSWQKVWKLKQNAGNSVDVSLIALPIYVLETR